MIDTNKLFSVKEKAVLTSGNTNSAAFKKAFKLFQYS